MEGKQADITLYFEGGIIAQASSAEEAADFLKSWLSDIAEQDRRVLPTILKRVQVRCFVSLEDGLTLADLLNQSRPLTACK